MTAPKQLRDKIMKCAICGEEPQIWASKNIWNADITGCCSCRKHRANTVIIEDYNISRYMMYKKVIEAWNNRQLTPKPTCAKTRQAACTHYHELGKVACLNCACVDKGN